MTAHEFSRSKTPPGGWVFRQPTTNWSAPTPIASTFDQTVQLIIKHRKANPAITAKHKLSTNIESVSSELERYTRKRLGLPEEQTPLPFQDSRKSFAGKAGDVAGDSTASLLKAAQNTAIPIEWLRSGGMPVTHDLANKRAAICVECPKNETGQWFTVAAGEIIKKTIELRSDLKLFTDYDDKLQSCGVCSCLLRAKVHCPLEVIVEKTKPEVMGAFPETCWIPKRDQI